MPWDRKSALSFLLILVFSFAIGSYVRLYTLINYTSFESSEKAALYVIDQVRNRVINDIDRNAPNISPAEKNRLIKKNFDHIIKHEHRRVLDTIQQVAKTLDLKLQRTLNFPYLLASDSYYYLALTQTIAETGRLSEHIKGSKYFNPLMLAPLGFWEPINLYPYIGYCVYRSIQIFDPHVPLMYAVSFTPIVMTFFITLVFLLICRGLRCSSLVSFISCVLFLLTPIVLKRSMFAWYDDDPPMIFFTLLIVLLLFKAMDPQLTSQKRLIRIAVTGFAFTLFTLFWHGWMFLLSVTVFVYVLFIILNHVFLKNTADTRDFGRNAVILLGTVFVGIGVLFGFGEFFVLFKEGAVALNDFINKRISSWPDLYLGVGELKKTPLRVVIDLTGGIYYFLIALLGLITTGLYTFYDRDKEKLYRFLFLFIFFIASVILAVKALRFTLLSVIPIAILFPIGLQFLFDRISFLIHEKAPGLNSKKKFLAVGAWIITLLMLTPYVRFAYQNVPELLNKIFNSTWEKALVKIQKETPQNSIINTWWPPGHFIKAIARRSVTFDGATINKPQGYWMANILLSRDEKEAMGLLRMLNNSANEATEYLESLPVPLSKSVETLKSITSLNKESAERYLKTKLDLSDPQIQQLLNYTHPKPAPSYLLVFNETVEKNIELKFIGGWDFKKIEELNQDPEALKAVPARKSPEYTDFLWKISGGPYRFSRILCPIGQKEPTIIFEQNVQINLLTKDTVIASQQFGKGIPLSIFYLENNQIVERKLSNSNLPYSVILFKEENDYKTVLLDRVLAQSLLMRMYFFPEAGLKYFKLFTEESDLTHRTKIFVYQLDWDKFFADLE
ncbi:MAG: hypothetical protein A2Z88_09490 [Omnitrophica WOR_2 bacterium GWA2_47_8]|nr:MAG: hypothetical protein A2Z88_09490 [Omnitrophica WOR_2 bacterium GWA2_47_8]